MIYFLHAIAGGPVKIGNSDLPEKRRGTIDTLFPYGVEIIATVPGGRIGEAFLHHCMAPVRLRFEWFNPCVPVWKLLIDAAEGRLDFLPSEKSPTSEEIRSDAVHLFGSLEAAKDALGYSRGTPIGQTFGPSFTISAKLAFHMALVEGRLPPYIAELHARRLPAVEAA
jgi:hypothetical protein